MAEGDKNSPLSFRGDFMDSLYNGSIRFIIITRQKDEKSFFVSAQ